MSTKQDPPPAAAADAAADAKKKKRVVVTPPCPPSVSTGYLVLRSAMMGVLGVDNSKANVSLLQATYIKEKEPTGKFAMTLGKKLGTECQLDLPEDSNERTVLLQQLQVAANRIIQESHDIHLFTSTQQHLVTSLGKGVLDASHTNAKKCPPTQELTCAVLQGLLVAVPPSIPFATTGAIAGLEIDCSQSFITSGVKARKAEIVLKFKVKVHPAAATLDLATTTATATPTPTPTATATATATTTVVSSLEECLTNARVRMPEGKKLLQQQQDATAATLAKVMEQATLAAAAAAEEEETPPPTLKSSVVKSSDKKKMVVTVEKVEGDIDYDKLIREFGSKIITDHDMQRLEALTVGSGNVPFLHRFLRRNIFFSHRDLTNILDCVESKQPIYLYTGRGPSSTAMHLGHLVPFLFTQWLQQAFDCPLVIQMTDDEKFLFKGEYNEGTGDNLDNFRNLTMENARDIIACGFDYDKTFLFSDCDYVGTMYPNIVRIWKAVTTNTVNGIFGFDGTSNIGKIAFPAIQAAPSFASSFPVVLDAKRDSDMACLIPCAIDQDPYFRMTRDVAHKLTTHKKHKLGGKPALIHSKFFPPLQGASGKMSSSDGNSAVFLTDSPEEIEKKIKNYAFSGGQETKKLQEERGADLDADVSYQWLRFFMEDDNELKRIGDEYGSGSGEHWSTGKVKQTLIQVLQDIVAKHQERRAKITDEEVKKWMTERCIVGTKK